MKGSCHCGAIRYSVSKPPFASEYCHCLDCQKITGAPVTAWMDFKAEEVKWDTETPSEYQSSPNVRRGFCAQCGATMSYRSTKHPKYMSLSVMSLDNPSLVKPSLHIYYESKVSWLEINDTLKKYPKALNRD